MILEIGKIKPYSVYLYRRYVHIQIWKQFFLHFYRRFLVKIHLGSLLFCFVFFKNMYDMKIQIYSPDCADFYFRRFSLSVASVATVASKLYCLPDCHCSWCCVNVSIALLHRCKDGCAVHHGRSTHLVTPKKILQWFYHLWPITRKEGRLRNCHYLIWKLHIFGSCLIISKAQFIINSWVIKVCYFFKEPPLDVIFYLSEVISIIQRHWNKVLRSIRNVFR